MMHCSHGFPLTSKCVQCVEEALGREDARKPRSLKPKSCKQCRQKFIPRNKMHTVCSPLCAKQHAEAARQKKERQDTRERLIAIKPRQKWLKEAEAAVNKYVRLRDHHLGCISCDKPASWHGQWHASHWRSVGASSATRFNLWNIHKACSICNNWKSGNIGDYTPALEKKIGRDKLEWLKAQTNPVTYSIEYLARLKRIFNKKANRLEKRLAPSR